MFQTTDLEYFPVAAQTKRGSLRRAYVLPRGKCPPLAVYFLVDHVCIVRVSVGVSAIVGHDHVVH